MQEPSKYEDDCLRLVRYIIDHDPSSIVQNKNIKESYDRIWKDIFKCQMKTDHLYNTYSNN
jgi:hypothetical protein